jgi:hypothetical protein
MSRLANVDLPAPEGPNEIEVNEKDAFNPWEQ